MQRILIGALCVFLASSACKGCDETGGSSNNSQTNNSTTSMSNNDTLPDGCEDADGDGTPTGLSCDGEVDCDDGDPAIHPGAEEACFDGVDNDCDGATDEGCPECTDGDTQSCGSDVGRCTAGTQTCADGVWSDCEGDEGPFSETCNGEDDDCDGEVDERGGLLCDDGVACNGVEQCTDGACTVGEPVDCSHLDGPCLEGICSEKDRGCRAAPKPNGEACDDGLYCTTSGVCQAGECQTEPRDCSSEEDQCNIGVCDEAVDSCVKQPKSDGIACDDGNFCTVQDSCTAGACGGPQRDCSSAADQCNDGVCDEQANACVPQPVTDGTVCDDGLYCNVGETCQAGQCAGGSARSCGAVGGSCRTGTCNEAIDACDGDPVPDGTGCDDGEFCTVNDACLAGSCEGGSARDCSSADGLCKVGSCNENLNICASLPAPDGTACDDSSFCTVGDSCQAGSCGGSMRDCSAVGDACTVGTCDDTSDSCVPQPVSDGTGCPDNLFCTQNEVCVAGSCNRDPRDCSGAGDVCNDGICDESGDACVAQPKPDGTGCNDGMFCTENDSCQAGACTGGPRSCSQFDDVCTMGTCDEASNTCEAAAVPDNTSCDDGQWCTQSDLCTAGVCSGSPRNCSAAGDQCNDGVCDESSDNCVAQPRADGTSCDDGAFCTNPDACVGGVCTGPDRDCSGAGDQCNDGVCDETNNGCVPQPVADGTGCDDGAFCTQTDECSSGACVGLQRDCSGATGGDPCLDGVCDDMVDMCVTMDNGTCDLCQMGTPTADAGSDQTAIPNETVLLDGSGSSDPTGQNLTYSWRVDSRPTGSTAQISDTSAQSPTLLADVSGDFVVCLVAEDPDMCVSNEDCMTITVEPLVDLHIELVWFSDDSDLDLHYQAPDYSDTKWYAAGTCWFADPNPDWGGGATGDGPDFDATNDPALDVDNVNGFGPENINQSNLFDGNPFTIGVHYWQNSDRALGPVTGDVSARIRVFESGTLIFERTRTMGCREFWEVAEVEVTGGGTSVNVTPKNNVSVTASDGSEGICRCDSDSDCPAGETCQSVRFNPRGPGGPITKDVCWQ